MMQDLKAQLAQAQTLIGGAERLVVFTGAGISADSGIPTYRGEGGLWTEYDPDKYANIAHFRKDPSYYWRFFRDVRYPALRDARPNPAHEALAALETAGRLKALITQNIDGLHAEAGSRNVLELHGNTRRYYCEQCDHRLALEQVWTLLQTALPPPCPACGGSVRPDVVFFGELLSEPVLRGALEAARQADLMLVVGSSLVVHPAAGLPVLTIEHGGKLIIVNKGETPLDRLAAVTLNASAADVLPHITATLV
ncbi:MAG: NAD-dependent deacylase [bacterium]